MSIGQPVQNLSRPCGEGGFKGGVVFAMCLGRDVSGELGGAVGDASRILPAGA